MSDSLRLDQGSADPQTRLRVFVLLCGIAGAAAFLGLVLAMWDLLAMMAKHIPKEPGKDTVRHNLIMTGLAAQALLPFLCLGAALCVSGGVLAFLRFRWLPAALFLAGAACPAVLQPLTLCAGFPLLSAALSLRIRGRGHFSLAWFALLPLLGSAVAAGLFTVSARLGETISAYREKKAEWPARRQPQLVPYEAIQDEVEMAGQGAALVRLDLSPFGINATMDVPAGAKAEKAAAGIQIEGERFLILIESGRRAFDECAEFLLTQGTPLVDTPTLAAASDVFGGGWWFVASKTFGVREVVIRTRLPLLDQSGGHTRSECMLMIRCARSLAPKEGAAPSSLREFMRLGHDPALLPGHVRLAPEATDAVLGLLAKDGKTRILDLSKTQVTDAGLAHLKGLAGLEELDLEHCAISDAGVAHLSGLKRLRRLILQDDQLTDEALKHLTGLRELESLVLPNGSNRIRGPGIVHLASLPKLKELILSGKLDDAALGELRGMKSLETLRLFNHPIQGIGLAGLKDSPRLRLLDVKVSRIDDDGLAALSGFAALEELELPWARISGSGLKHLKPLSRLKRLNLMENPLSDKGAAHLAALSSLEELTLSDTAITDAGLEHLRALKKLKKLHLYQTKTTMPGVERLRAALPGAEIGWAAQ